MGLSKKDAIFPTLYEEEMISKFKNLNKIPHAVRNQLKSHLKKIIVSKTFDLISDYIEKSMSIGPDNLRNEYDLLSSTVKDNIEGGLEGYFACRIGLINAFGSETNVVETIQKANEYYGSLVRADFLQDDQNTVKGQGTLVHSKLKSAFEKAEELINARGWRQDVLMTTKQYWSTRIRENRNLPIHLSQHSYGRAVDINPDDNRNLAKFKKNQEYWGFIEEFVGEDIFTTTGKDKTEVVETIISEESDTEKILEAVKKLRSQSDRFKQIFENEENLKTRLGEILKERGTDLSSEEMTQLFNLAKETVYTPKKMKELSKKLIDQTFSFLWKKSPSYSIDINEEVNPIVSQIVKRLSKTIKNHKDYSNKKAIIESQVNNPSTSLSKEAKNLGLRRLFQRKLVNQLLSIPESDRPKIAQQVMNRFKVKLDRKQIQIQTKNISDYLKQAFQTFKGTRKNGNKVGPGEGLHNIAAHGFTNLSPKLITALVSPQGGNLKWLGVHNQDMHHFELKEPEKLPKAAAKVPQKKNDEPSKGTPSAQELTI